MHTKTTTTVAALLLTALTGCTGTTTPAAPAPARTSETTTNAGTVVYRTTGPKGATVSYVTADGSEQTTAKTKTWAKTFPHDGDFVIYSLAVTGTATSKGTVSCTITLDGKTISHHQSDGLYATASCSGSGL